MLQLQDMQRTQWKWDTEYKEGIQQDVISNSVEVNIKNRVTIASLPLTQNPAVKPAPNNEKPVQITISKYESKFIKNGQE